MALYLYVRYSSEEQKNGDSEPRQIRAGEAWAKAHETTITKIFFDRGVSGFYGANRVSGEFAKLLEVVQKGDTILIENNDRFGRDDVLPAMNELQAIARNGVKIVFLDGNIEVNETNFYDLNVFLPNMLKQLLGREENKKKAKRLRETWGKKKKAAINGVILTEMAPSWLNVDKKKNSFELNNHAKTVTRIFESYASGTPIRTIVRQLNADKVKPFGKGTQNKSGAWSSTHVRRTLAWRAVLGEYQPGKQINGKKRENDGLPIIDYYPPVIDKELFYKCQLILARNVSVSCPKSNGTNLFTGFIKCSRCGGAMHIKDGTKGKYIYTYLFCAGANNHSGCLNKGKIQYKHVERAVLTLLWSKVLPEMAEANARLDKLSTSKVQLIETENGINNLISAIEKIGIDDAISNRIGKLKSEKAFLIAEIEQLESLVSYDALADWETCEPTIKNRLRLQNILRGEINSLRIDAAERKAWLDLKDPEMTFEIVWNYQKANHNKKNPADLGFYVTDFDTHDLQNTFCIYQDELFVWKTANSIPLAQLLNREFRITEHPEIEATLGQVLDC